MFKRIKKLEVVDKKYITNCHEYILRGELERDIKAFLYKSNKGEK